MDGFSAIFTSGFTIIRYHIKEIMKYETDNLISFLISDMCNQEIFKNENFEKIKKYYEINSKYINDVLIKKLLEILVYEKDNPYLQKN